MSSSSMASRRARVARTSCDVSIAPERKIQRPTVVADEQFGRLRRRKVVARLDLMERRDPRRVLPRHIVQPSVDDRRCRQRPGSTGSGCAVARVATTAMATMNVKRKALIDRSMPVAGGSVTSNRIAGVPVRTPSALKNRLAAYFRRPAELSMLPVVAVGRSRISPGTV